MRFVVLATLSFLVTQCFATVLRNSAANLVDVFSYIVASRRKLVEYQMAPSRFDMADTNLSYMVEFAPKRACPHHIKLVWQGNEVSKLNRGDGECWPNFMSNAVFRIAITNLSKERSQEIVVEAPKTSVFYGERDLKPKYYESCIWCFHVADFPWRYCDRIKVKVQLLRAPSCSNYQVDCPRVVVTEWYPFY